MATATCKFSPIQPFLWSYSILHNLKSNYMYEVWGNFWHWWHHAKQEVHLHQDSKLLKRDSETGEGWQTIQNIHFPTELVYWPTQLICIWIIICSMRKAKGTQRGNLPPQNETLVQDQEYGRLVLTKSSHTHKRKLDFSSLSLFGFLG